MDGIVRQLYDYDGSNLFPRTKPSAFVSDLYDSNATGITTIGELIDSSKPGNYEPEFVYRIPASDTQSTGSTHGTLKAVKLTDVKALHFNAVLTDDFTVTNPVGNATSGKTYRAGTSLETIIIDMLSGGVSVYDVARTLPSIGNINVQYSTDGGNYNLISNNQTVTLNENDDLTIRYSFSFTDGKYTPTSGYRYDLFQLYNDININNGYYVDGNPPYLKGGSDPSSLKLTSGNNTIDSQNNPSSGTSYVTHIGTASEDKLYVITVTYSKGQSVPYKSNGVPSDKKIESDSSTFTFRINRVQGDIFYPERVNPQSALNNFFQQIRDEETREKYYRDGAYLLPTDFTEWNTPDSSLIAKSNYDVSKGTSTGIWTGDRIIIGTPYYFGTNVSKHTTPNPNSDFMLYATGTEYVETYGPTFGVLSTGEFKPSASYTNESFKEHNSAAIESNAPMFGYPFVVADCSYNSNLNPVAILRKGNAFVSQKDLTYGTGDNCVIVKPLWKVQDSGQNDRIIEYYATLNYKDQPIIVSDALSDGYYGDYNLFLRFNYKESTATVYNSDGSEYNNSIPSANVNGYTADSFEVKREVDVDVSIDASVYIKNIVIDGVSYQNGEQIVSSSNLLSGYYTFKAGNKSCFKPGSSVYTIDEFNSNNQTVNGELDASCEWTNFLLKIANNDIGSLTPLDTDLDSDGWGKFYFNNVPVNTINNQVTRIYGFYESTATPKKRSNRPSDKKIDSSATENGAFSVNINTLSYVTITLNASPSDKGTVRFSTTPVGMASESSTMVIGTSYTAIAEAYPNCSFVNWTKGSPTGEVISNASIFNASAGTNQTLYANFIDDSPESHTVTLVAAHNGGSSGTVKFEEPESEPGEFVRKELPSGTQYIVRAIPGENSVFTEWINADNHQTISNNEQYTGTVTDSDINLIAYFNKPASTYTARLLTTTKVLETDTNQLLSTITSIDDILTKKVSGVDEWSDTVSPTISEDVTIPLSPTESYGVDNNNNSRTIVAIVPANWNIKNIELQNPVGLNNGFFDRGTGVFDSSTSTEYNEFTYTVDGLSYKVYAKKNPNATRWAVSQIVFKKSE